MLILKYGSYSHSAGEALIQITRTPKHGQGGFRLGYVDRWNIGGTLFADTQAALTTALQALETAYSTNGNDLTLYLSDGTTETAHKLVNANSSSGVRVVEGVSYPSNGANDAQYSTFRDYSLAIEAEFLVAENEVEQDSVESWVETLSITGTGGPRFVIHEPLNGPPLRQITHQRTPVRASQRGSAVGRSRYPSIGVPIFPAAEHLDQREISYKTPKRGGTVGRSFFSEYEVTWSYSFTSPVPLSAFPNSWPF